MKDACRTALYPPPQGESVSASAQGLRISVRTGASFGTHICLQPPVIIGRGAGAQVRIPDDTVSELHVEIGLCAEGITIHDLKSRNGVKVGGLRIDRGVVPSGTTIAMGASTAMLEVMVSPEMPPEQTGAFGGLVGNSKVMRELYVVLRRLARNDLSVLIQGDTGTGKEAAARAIKGHSPRAQGPLVVLDCTAIPDTLAESILFGHEKGAFTGADKRQVGVFEAANGGVLFIDEVGELPRALQPKLLRVLDRHEVVPLGSSTPRKVDVRVISATWRDLREMVNLGTFREDLYYRLTGASIWMPPLSERREDLGALVEHFLTTLKWNGPAARAIAPEALEVLSTWPFRGNVRELIHTVSRLAQLAAGAVISTEDLAFERLLNAERRRPIPPTPVAMEPTPVPAVDTSIQLYKDAKRTTLDEFERGYLQRLMVRAEGNLSHAALIAGLERHNLRELLKKHDLYVIKK